MKGKKDKLFDCSAVQNGIEIEITSYCGLSCIVCARGSLEQYNFINFDVFKDIISLVKEGNYKEIMVCGLGDAFLHESINEFMEYVFVEIPSINLTFMTKGLAIKDKHLEKMLDLKNRGFNVSLVFSVFSLKEKVYNYLTGGNFHSVFMQVMKKVHNMNLNYSMEFLLSPLTLNELNTYKKFSNSLGKETIISLVHNWGGTISKAIHKQMFDEIKLEGYFVERSETDLCEVMKYDSLYIDSLGGVYQCSINTVAKTGYLGQVGEYPLEFFLAKKNNLNYNKICTECFYYKYKTFN